MPEEIKGWNWGAFILCPFWGIRFGVYRALLSLIPGMGFFVMIWLGLRGNKLAWEADYWVSTYQFKQAQRRWSAYSLIYVILTVSLTFAVVNLDRVDEEFVPPFEMSLKEVSDSKNFKDKIGTPFTTDFNYGRIIPNEAGEISEFGYSIIGLKGQGYVSVSALNQNDEWKIRCLYVFYPEKTPKEAIIPCGSYSQ
ncbi:hypothetical protein [Thaumasiovibrio subtropicus]|nr:hypothetical protein [Thaumasiovibrio subtropicus]